MNEKDSANKPLAKQGAMYKMKDRRQAPRVKREVIVRFRVKDIPIDAQADSFNSQIDISRTKDISEKGIYFNVGNFIPPQAILDIKLQMPIQREALHIEGRVINCEEVKKNYIYVVRVEFINIDEDCRKTLSQFIENFLNSGKK